MPPTHSVHAEHGGASFDAIGNDFRSLDRRADVVNADVLDAWYDPSPRVVAAVQQHLAWLLRTSPPTHAEGLVRSISEVRGIPEENLIVGAGTSSLAYLALPFIVRTGDRALILDPTYGEYAHVLEAVHGMRCQRLPLRPEDGFRIDVGALTKAMQSCDVVVLVNPNSPTGTMLGQDDLRRIMASVSRFGTLVVDETYVDFAPGVPSVETWVKEHDNVVVLKSMSKYYALSGLRVGYLAGPTALCAKLRPSSPPWSVSLVGQVAAVEALRDETYYRAKAEETRELRDALVAELEAVPGLRPHGSAANFVLLELLGDATAAEVVARAAERGVYLRNCDSFGTTLGGRFIRTAVKDGESNGRIAAALRAVVPAPRAPRVDVALAEPVATAALMRAAPASLVAVEDAPLVHVEPAPLATVETAPDAAAPSTEPPTSPPSEAGS